uniref:HNH nuclease domain-containing protein n=1 Tax=viral metagenome TaxID=1070528 RepID=A0A6C0HCA8_9ZZZZ
MANCLAIDRNSNQCRNYGLDKSRFCIFHQYMNDYSEEMLANQKICGTCKKSYYLENGRKVCNRCREQSKMNALKYREQVILCGKQGCKFKRSEENKYCNKHQLCIFEDETKALNKKLCYNVIRGCRSQLELDYKFSKCSVCLEKDRNKDNERRNKAKQQYNENVLENRIRESKLCTICCIERPMEMFIGVAISETKTCKICRDDNKRQDLKRDKDHRNELARTNINEKFRLYQKSCLERCLEFKLSFDEFISIVNNDCFYCGYKNSDFVNGIDRIDSKKGYILDNCVACCKMCNYMKASLSIDVFIKRAEHTLTYQNRINGNLYPECFPNHKCLPYYRYKSRALEKQLDFSITKEDYNDIIQNACFLCGKQNNENHTNGIDRMDSKKGYVLDNINACCSECNFMKRDYDYNDFINKLLLIYEKHKNHNFSLNNLSEYVNIPQNRTKKSIEEIKKTNDLFKQEQNKIIKEKYGDEEYKQMRVKEIAKYRTI